MGLSVVELVGRCITLFVMGQAVHAAKGTPEDMIDDRRAINRCRLELMALLAESLSGLLGASMHSHSAVWRRRNRREVAVELQLGRLCSGI